MLAPRLLGGNLLGTLGLEGLRGADLSLRRGEAALERRGIPQTLGVGLQKTDTFLLKAQGPISAFCSVFCVF